MAAGVIKAEVPPKSKSEAEEVDKDDPTSREITEAQQAVGNVKPGMSSGFCSYILSPTQSSLLVAFDIQPARDVPEPSSETPVQQPEEPTDVGGSLPGSKDEQAVTALPDERSPQITESSPPKPTERAQEVSLPSTETQGQQPGERTGGAGSLPGSKDEQGVAVLPDERATTTKTTEEPGDAADKPKKDPGATDKGVVGTTEPLEEESQSRVSSDLHFL